MRKIFCEKPYTDNFYETLFIASSSGFLIKNEQSFGTSGNWLPKESLSYDKDSFSYDKMFLSYDNNFIVIQQYSIVVRQNVFVVGKYSISVGKNAFVVQLKVEINLGI